MRKAIPQETQTKVLIACRRRCCVCFGLNTDDSEKRGQIAHLDRNPENTEIDNLAWLCLLHHDLYDSRTSQSKGLTRHEVARFRSDLVSHLERSYASSALRQIGVEPPSHAAATHSAQREEGQRAAGEPELDAWGYPTFLQVSALPWDIRLFVEGPSPGAVSLALDKIAPLDRKAVADCLFRGRWARWSGRVQSIRVDKECIVVLAVADGGGKMLLTFRLAARPSLRVLRTGDWIRILGQIRSVLDDGLPELVPELVKVEILECKPSPLSGLDR